MAPRAGARPATGSPPASPSSLAPRRRLLQLASTDEGHSVFGDWSKPQELPTELPPASLLLEVDMPAGALVRKRYGKPALAGEAGPFTIELTMVKGVATTPGPNTDRVVMHMTQPISNETFERAFEGPATRWLGFYRFRNPGALLTLHSYIAHAEDFFLYLTFTLQRNGGKFEEACKQVLVGAGSWPAAMLAAHLAWKRRPALMCRCMQPRPLRTCSSALLLLPCY
jgi:hypothetical protein